MTGRSVAFIGSTEAILAGLSAGREYDAHILARRRAQWLAARRRWCEEACLRVERAIEEMKRSNKL
jgi:hypothetical protein